MNQVLAKAQIEANITSRFGSIFKIAERAPADFLSSGIAEIDALTGGGLPRGAITEIVGAASSGRASLLSATLADAMTRSETCALVDTSDSFDPASAGQAGVDFNSLLWVRCGNSMERAFKATDVLLQSGGFGFVALNFADIEANYARRIISSWWFRFRRAIENTPTTFMVISPVACVRSCASVILKMKNHSAIWHTSSSVLQRKNAVDALVHLTKGRQISLVKDSRPPHSASFLTHGYLLRAIDIQVKLAKPTTWIEESVRFYQVT
jgi:recombination protein RecA